MFKFIKISSLLSIFFERLNAQNNFNKQNLATICACYPIQETSINLSSKNIKTIDPATFTGLASLQTLWLNNNQISSINPSSFNGLYSLEKLYLNNNKITHISEKIFYDLISKFKIS